MIFLADSTAVQAGKFSLVGVLNTAIDFAVFNLLSGKRVGLSKIQANFISTTVAMICSFFLNREAVFRGGEGSVVHQAVIFFAVTAFGLYVLQNAVLYLLLRRWNWPAKLVTWLLTLFRINLSTDFVLKNGAKLAATVVSLAWNFVLYKYVVFA